MRLRWLVQNLIENASQHAGGDVPYRGTVRVRVFQQDGAPALSVADDGVGVAPGHLSRLTERFYRASPSTPGSGLGLAIVDEVARAHGARLHFASPPGEGMTVSVAFPPRRGADAPT